MMLSIIYKTWPKTASIKKGVYKMNITELKNKLEEEQKRARGIYEKAICQYAFELVDNIADNYITTADELEHLENITNLKERALNGAENWTQYSWGGCSLCYNYDILSRLFCPSIVKKYKNADTVRGCHLLDYQASALTRAFSKINFIIKMSKAGA